MRLSEEGCLMYSHKDLSLDPPPTHTHIKSQASPSAHVTIVTEQREVRGFLWLAQLQVLGETLPQKSKVESGRRGSSTRSSGRNFHTCTYTFRNDICGRKSSSSH